MIKAIKLYSSFDLKKLTPQTVFSFDKLAKQVFEAVSEQVKTVDILKRFNEVLAQEEYSGISQVLNPDGCFKIEARVAVPNSQPLRGRFLFVHHSAKKAGLGRKSALCRVFVLVWGVCSPDRFFAHSGGYGG